VNHELNLVLRDFSLPFGANLLLTSPDAGGTDRPRGPAGIGRREYHVFRGSQAL
jgi:hypothetical protein